MSIHTLPWTFEEIGKGENKALAVEFECHVSSGSPGSYLEPPTPSEVEFTAVTVIEICGSDGQIPVGSSWKKFLEDIAFDLAERNRDSLAETLSERVGDYEDAAREEYYDRKRDELRGC